jgi:putative membrane protein
MRPAMILSWLFGIILIWINGIESFAFLWVQIKIILVIFLTIYHEYLGKCMRLLKLKENKKSSKFYRIINEIPTVLLIFIVFIVVFKPL